MPKEKCKTEKNVLEVVVVESSKKSARPLKLIKLSSRPGIKANIPKA
jgi:hypothetical protein